MYYITLSYIVQRNIVDLSVKTLYSIVIIPCAYKVVDRETDQTTSVCRGLIGYERVGWMSTKHIEFQLKLRVPVDKLEILDGPAERVIKSAIGIYSTAAYNKPKDGIKARFKVMTPASSMPFHISGTICEAVDRRESKIFGCEYTFWFFTKEGELLVGKYNPSGPRVGELVADYYDPWDLTDHRNID